MSSLKYRSSAIFDAERPVSEAARRVVAGSLRNASAALARLARRIGRSNVRAPHPEPQLEFSAEAGAPEGALYLDGRLVGWISGVNRL